tara:strand:+ start:620 stop:964 length:345 start_codon:yes stop_codon:yes gene_type:complete
MNTIPLPDINTQKMIIKMGERIEELEKLTSATKVKTSLGAEYLQAYTSQEYQAPSFKEVRTLKEELNLSGTDIANICGTTPRNVRAWMSEEDSANARKIPYSAWRLLLIETNVV